jgi:hypothetical protein
MANTPSSKPSEPRAQPVDPRKPASEAKENAQGNANLKTKGILPK